MANEQNRNPGSEQSDISKSQAQQQPQGQAGQQRESGQQGGQFETSQQGRDEQSGDRSATGQSQTSGSPDLGTQGDTLTQQRTDVEGGSLRGCEFGLMRGIALNATLRNVALQNRTNVQMTSFGHGVTFENVVHMPLGTFPKRYLDWGSGAAWQPGV